MASETCTLFKDQFNQAYALVRINGHYESIKLKSQKFTLYLTKLFYDHNSNIPTNKESVVNAIQILESKAIFEGATIPLHLRVAWSEDKKSIYYDLTNRELECC